MTSSGKRPLRIVVMASSVGYYVRPPERNGPARPYPAALADELRAAGIEAEVVNHSGWFRMVHEASRNVQEMVVPTAPEVVVLNFGILEAESTLLPTWLVKSVYHWNPTTNRLWSAARRRLLLPVHRFHVQLAPTLMRRLGSWHRLSPRRFEAELRSTVRWLRKERNALVLVLNINPVGDNVERTLPGTRRSVAQYNSIIDRVVRTEADGLTRLVDVHAVVAEGNGEGLLVADGIHYTAEGHRAVAGLLAGEIDGWLSGQAAGIPRIA